MPMHYIRQDQSTTNVGILVLVMLPPRRLRYARAINLTKFLQNDDGVSLGSAVGGHWVMPLV